MKHTCISLGLLLSLALYGYSFASQVNIQDDKIKKENIVSFKLYPITDPDNFIGNNINQQKLFLYTQGSLAIIHPLVMTQEAMIGHNKFFAHYSSIVISRQIFENNNDPVRNLQQLYKTCPRLDLSKIYFGAVIDMRSNIPSVRGADCFYEGDLATEHDNQRFPQATLAIRYYINQREKKNKKGKKRFLSKNDQQAMQEVMQDCIQDQGKETKKPKIFSNNE